MRSWVNPRKRDCQIRAMYLAKCYCGHFGHSTDADERCVAMLRKSLLVFVFVTSSLLSSSGTAWSQPPSMPSAQDRMDEMRQRMDQQMEESRARHDQMVNDMRSRMNDPDASANSSTARSTTQSLRPYRRLIRWGIGALILGGVAVWKMATRREA